MCQDYAVPHIQNLLPAQKTNSVYGSGNTIVGSHSSTCSANVVGPKSSQSAIVALPCNSGKDNYAATAACNRNTFSHMVQAKLPPPPGRSLATLTAHMPSAISNNNATLVNSNRLHHQQQQQQQQHSHLKQHHHAQHQHHQLETESTLKPFGPQTALEKFYTGSVICKGHVTSPLSRTPCNSSTVTPSHSIHPIQTHTLPVVRQSCSGGGIGDVADLQISPSNPGCLLNNIINNNYKELNEALNVNETTSTLSLIHI